MLPNQTQPSEPTVFESFLVPYRSLSRSGVKSVIAVAAIASWAVALRFWLWGAWPVAMFSLAEVPLLGVLLAINFKQARASESITLNAEQLTVIRTDPAGRRRGFAMPSAWLRVDLNGGSGLSRLIVRSHGRGCEIGAFLHEPDRLTLYASLRDALHRIRNPRFDNPGILDREG